MERLFAGSEDGEAIVGFNKKGEMVKLIHLDPETIANKRSSANLLAFLLSHEEKNEFS